MPFRWKLFAIASYLLLAGYAILLVSSIRFIIITKLTAPQLNNFIPVIAGIFFIFFNAALNVFVFHRHLPDKPFRRWFGLFYFASLLLSALSMVFVLISLFPEVMDEIYAVEHGPLDYFLTIVFISTVVLGSYTTIYQFLIRRFILKKRQESLNRMIEAIGKKES